MGQVMCFVAHLFESGFAPSSIASHVSAIAYAHKTMSLCDPTDNFVIRKLLTGASRLATQPDKRLPITPSILRAILSALSRLNLSAYQRALFKSPFTLAFFGFLRMGEVAVPSQSQPHYVIQLADIEVTNSHILLTMHTYKHSSGREPTTLHILCQPPAICPVNALTDYLKYRGTTPGPLFAFPDLRPLSRAFVTSTLTLTLKAAGFDSAHYKGHSFRIGAGILLFSDSTNGQVAFSCLRTLHSYRHFRNPKRSPLLRAVVNRFRSSAIATKDPSPWTWKRLLPVEVGGSSVNFRTLAGSSPPFVLTMYLYAFHRHNK